MKVFKYAAVMCIGMWLAVPLAAQQTVPELLQQIKDDADKITGLLAMPNPPVNCTVSVFTMKLPAPAWGACVAGLQTRQETWERTKLTPESNGGTCVSLTETRTGSQACGVVPPPTGTPVISGVSGVFTNGASVTVSGANFGSKAAQQPWKWDDMSGVNGARLEPRGWLVHQNTPQPLLSTVQKRPGHTTSVQIGQTGPDVPDFAFGDNGANYLSLTSASAVNLRTPPTTLLLDYWMYFANGGVANNYKFWRWHTFANPGSSNRYWSMPSGNTASDSSTMTYFNSIGVATIHGKWTHHRVYLHPSSVQREVYFQHSIDQRIYMTTGANGDYVPPDSGFTAGPWPTVASGDRLSTWVWEMQNDTAGNGARNSKMYLNDVVVDDGYGAVYLGSASTWAASSHTEYQSYTAWADGRVTVKVNKGTFSAGQAWLYLVNNGRLVNVTGFAVVLP